MKILIAITAAALCASASLPARSQDAGDTDKAKLEKVFPAKPAYSPYAGRNLPMRPFFGDTHLHTSFSMDAGAVGARLLQERAYTSPIWYTPGT